MQKRGHITGIAQIGLHCNNLQTSKTFYQQVLGLELVFESEPNLALLKCGELQIMLSHEPEYLPITPQNSPIIYLEVNDIFAVYQQLSNQTVEFENPPRCVSHIAGISVWQAFLRDPDGHLLGIQSQVESGRLF